VTDSESERAWAHYDEAESAYLTALSGGVAERELAALAQDVAAAASASELADRRLEPTEPGIQRYYDVPEVLSTLWADIAAAYERRGR
jgi:xanthine/CO dehydrogenase XdhC/CoxF family maturation factor